MYVSCRGTPFKIIPAENCSKRIYPYPTGYQLIDSGVPYLKEFLSVTI